VLTTSAANGEWVRIPEINPPELANNSHLLLENVWSNVLITDNVFGKIRVSPYAFAARITHDVPVVSPTVVVSTRDRNILAIESEVRGAIGNGVDSFLVVIGDTMPHVDHLADHYEIVEHLHELQRSPLPAFEVGMPTRFQRWQFRKRIDVGAEFFVAGPVIDPDTVEPSFAKLGRRNEDPPVFLMVIPPFSPGWVSQMESMGSVPTTEAFKEKLEATELSARREAGWQWAQEIERRAIDAGCAGVILMGLKYDTVVDEAAAAWR
jgi:5,10-methylenetetrahydrofolate reductase